MELIPLDEIGIGRFALQPGWRWSKDVAPVVRTRSCQGRHLAYTISGSSLVTMDDGTKLVIAAGDGYEIPTGHEVEVFGEEPSKRVEFASARTFGVAPEELVERVLATVRFSDIVGSTALLERLGDHVWAALLREHNARLRAAIDRFRGREITSTGDAFLALFDGAAKAVRAGALMYPAVAELGIRIPRRPPTEVETVGGAWFGHSPAQRAARGGILLLQKYPTSSSKAVRPSPRCSSASSHCHSGDTFALQPPTVVGVTPTCANAGTPFVISGTGLDPSLVTGVLIDGVPVDSTRYTVNSDTSITVIAPDQPGEALPVAVQTSQGLSQQYVPIEIPAFDFCNL